MSPPLDFTTIDTLIALVEERPTIWDKRIKSHSSRAYVGKCWKEISEAMNIDENTLRKKWKYLRDQYCVELGKFDTALYHIPKWRHFKALEFLNRSVTPRVYDKEVDQSEAESSSDYFTPATKKIKFRELKRKRKKVVVEAEKPIDDSAVSVDKPNEEDDEHIHFFRSVMPHVRKIPETMVLSFRSRIQSLVEEFAYGANATPDVEFVKDELDIKQSPPRFSSVAFDPINMSASE